MADESCLEKVSVAEEKLKKNPPLSWIGIISSLNCALFFAIATILAKMVTTDAIVIATLRNYIHYFITLPVIFFHQKPSEILGQRKSNIFLWLQGSSLALAAIFFHLALGELSASTTVTLTFIDVFYAPLLAWLFLRERLTVLDGIFSVLCFIGVMLIAKPQFIFSYLSSKKPESAIGVVYGLVAPFLASVSYVLLHRIGQKVHFLNSLFSMAVCGSFFGTITMVLMSRVRAIPCSRDLLLIGLVGILVLLAQGCFVIALKYETPGTVAILQTPQIIIIYIFQVLFLHDIPSALSLIGSGLIFISSICIGIRKFASERKRRASMK